MMAHSNDDESLIGYDPLAWMQDVKSEDPQEVDATAVIINDEFPAVALTAAAPELSAPATFGDNLITLDATQTIQNITALYERLAWALDSGHKIDIDASAVTTIDTATLQLLLIVTRTAVKLQREVVIDFPSDRFVEAARLLGLSELLGVEQSAAGFF